MSSNSPSFSFDVLNTPHFPSYVIMAATLIILIFFIIKVARENNNDKGECKKMNSLYPSVNNNISPINTALTTDSGFKTFDQPLSKYYVKTAYNACSGGKYKNDYVDICNLIAVIRQGVRCLDFEIYSIDNQPVVSTSTTNNFYVKETYDSVPFSTVMSTINGYAFASGTCPNYTDPLIIHLRMKSVNQQMYTNMAKIFKNYKDKMLGSEYNYDKNVNKRDQIKFLPNVTLSQLKGKIIIIAQKSNNAAFEDNANFMEYVNMVSRSDDMYAYSYNKFAFENEKTTGGLLNHNKDKLTIVFPQKGDNPPNPDQGVCRDLGCQFVAMRYQNKDEQLQDYEKFFNEKKHAFVIKPDIQR